MSPTRTSRTSQPTTGFAIPAPRAGDAIGDALRGVFRHDRTMPSGIADALIQLDRIR